MAGSTLIHGAVVVGVLAAAGCADVGCVLDDEAQEAFDFAEGSTDLEAGGVPGGEAEGTFVVGSVYTVTVDAATGTLSYEAETGTVSRCWDGSNDRLEGAVSDGRIGIVITDADRGGAGINYNEGEGALVGASWSPAGALPVYSFVPPGT